jgi:hypothetical protein
VRNSLIDGHRRRFAGEGGKLKRRLPHHTVPLTFQQHWLWNTLVPLYPAGTFTMSHALRLRGALNVGILERSLELLLQHHEALRTRIVVLEGVPRQQVQPAARYTLEVCSLEETPPDRAAEQASERVDSFVQEAIDHAAGPLFEARLFKLGARDHVLVMAIDHLIADGFSITVLMRDLCASYVRCGLGMEPPTPSGSLQYADYAVWQQQTCAHWQQRHGDYWQKRLSGAQPIRLPPDPGATKAAPARWEGIRIELGKQLTARFRQQVRRQKVTVPMGLLTAFATLIACWCKMTDFVLPFNIAGRPVPELADTVGYFAHVLHLRIELTGEETFCDVLHRVVQEYVTAYAHDDFGRIVTAMPQFARSTCVQCEPPLMQEAELASFGNDMELDAFPVHKRAHQGQVEVPDELIGSDELGYGVSMVFEEASDDVVATLGYRADRFTRQTMQEFCQQLRRLCEKFCAAPESRVLEVL